MGVGGRLVIVLQLSSKATCKLLAPRKHLVLLYCSIVAH